MQQQVFLKQQLAHVILDTDFSGDGKLSFPVFFFLFFGAGLSNFTMIILSYCTLQMKRTRLHFRFASCDVDLSICIRH